MKTAPRDRGRVSNEAGTGTTLGVGFVASEILVPSVPKTEAAERDKVRFIDHKYTQRLSSQRGEG